MEYRREIDGLRAVAVVPVILFHAGLPMFSGGYVGVDVFFVISGYLITGILLDDLTQGRFSIAQFYERRARRILPALFFVIACCLPFAWLWMLPQQLADFSKSVASISLFASNILFWREEGYFAAAAELKPLLHTWSLAVEEQFYLLFPICLAAIWKWRQQFALRLIVLAAILSLALSQWASHTAPSANFYLAPSRAWELLAGSICAFILAGRAPGPNNVLSLVGLGMILFAILAFDDRTPFPGLYALAPVLGTALIILYGPAGTISARLLGLPQFVGIGLISYSAYLWHQPLFAFARIRSIAEPSPWLMGALALLTFALAWFSWRYIERPFRSGPHSMVKQRSRIFALSAGAALLFSGLGVAGIYAKGFPERWSSRALQVLVAKEDKGSYGEECLTGTLMGAAPGDRCVLGKADRQRLDFIVIGDSFALAMADAISLAAQKNGTRGAIIASSSCPSILGVGGAWKATVAACERQQDTMVQIAANSGARAVLLASAWHSFDAQFICELSKAPCPMSQGERERFVFERTEATIAAFNRWGIAVYIIGHPPLAEGNVPDAMSRNRFASDDRIADLAYPRGQSYPGAFKAQLDKIRAERGLYVDISGYFCNGDQCFVSRRGVPLFHDRVHVTGTVSRSLAPYFMRATAAGRQ